jgi:hypothetical protein
MKNVKAGDVVLLVDNSAPRNRWPMGRVMEAISDDRGEVRSVKVKTQSGIFKRPIAKLILLLEGDVPDSASQ